MDNDTTGVGSKAEYTGDRSSMCGVLPTVLDLSQVGKKGATELLFVSLYPDSYEGFLDWERESKLERRSRNPYLYLLWKIIPMLALQKKTSLLLYGLRRETQAQELWRRGVAE